MLNGKMKEDITLIQFQGYVFFCEKNLKIHAGFWQKQEIYIIEGKESGKNKNQVFY